MVSMDDVARAAGVSTATVSRVINNREGVSAQATKRVQDAVDKLGYVVSAVASGLASGRTKNIGVLVPDLSRWYFSQAVHGIAERLAEFDQDLTLYSLSGKRGSRKAVFEEALRRRHPDGFIAISQEITDAEIARLQELNKPLVVIGGKIKGIHTLGIDEFAISRAATEHLVNLGHRRIAHIAGAREFQIDFNLPKTREAGYRQALADGNVEIDQSLIVPADFTVAGGYAVSKKLLERGEPPTAIFAASDEMAIGAIVAARELGLLPGVDISVVGIDGHHLGPIFGLTTVAQYPAEQGRRAVDILMAQLYPKEHLPLLASLNQSEPESNSYLLEADFIVRSSTGPVRPPDITPSNPD